MNGPPDVGRPICHILVFLGSITGLQASIRILWRGNGFRTGRIPVRRERVPAHLVVGNYIPTSPIGEPNIVLVGRGIIAPLEDPIIVHDTIVGIDIKANIRIAVNVIETHLHSIRGEIELDSSGRPIACAAPLVARDVVLDDGSTASEAYLHRIGCQVVLGSRISDVAVVDIA